LIVFGIAQGRSLGIDGALLFARVGVVGVLLEVGG
jgi:hypothetical protein